MKQLKTLPNRSTMQVRIRIRYIIVDSIEVFVTEGRVTWRNLSKISKRQLTQKEKRPLLITILVFHTLKTRNSRRHLTTIKKQFNTIQIVLSIITTEALLTITLISLRRQKLILILLTQKILKIQQSFSIEAMFS